MENMKFSFTKDTLGKFIKLIKDELNNKSSNFELDDTLTLSEDGKLGVATAIVILTKEEYDNLSEEEKMADNKFYLISDDLDIIE